MLSRSRSSVGVMVQLCCCLWKQRLLHRAAGSLLVSLPGPLYVSLRSQPHRLPVFPRPEHIIEAGNNDALARRSVQEFAVFQVNADMATIAVAEEHHVAGLKLFSLDP